MRRAARRGMWGVEAALLCGLLVGCTEPPVVATSGPAPAVDPAPAVAVLAVVEGQVAVRSAAGVEVAAAAEMPLVRTDTVITSPGALVVVVLANGYVLKLEEDQTTPVRALAHLDDPPPGESVAELFERALGAEAFARVGGAGRLERIAGWNARRASGETPAPVTKSDARAPEARAPQAAPMPEEEDAPTLDGAPKQRGGADEAIGGPVATRAPKKQSSRESEKKPGAPAEQAKRAESPTGGAPPPQLPPPPASAPAPAPVDLVDDWIFETGVKGHVAKNRLPALLAGRRAALAQCVAAALPAVTTPELRLWIVGGVIKDVALGGVGAAPACAESLVGQSLPEASEDGWAVVRVRR